MTASPDDLIGRTFDGRYRIESVAARGGMATVYFASDLKLSRLVALKVMHASLAEDQTFITRFAREAKAAAALTHPNVVSVFDQGRDQATGAMYLVMELVSGHTVRDVLTERSRLTPVQALAVLDPVLSALGAAHTAGFVHRDIKPENVMIADDGRVRVTDFGLARAIVDTDTTALTRGVLIGTVAYLAPEQVEKGHADARSDMYSAGILLFEMLTGTVPFKGDSPIAVAFQHVHSEIPSPSEMLSSIPAQFDAIVARATHRNAESRYQNAEEFLQDIRTLRDVLDGKIPEAPIASNVQLTEVIPLPTPAVEIPAPPVVEHQQPNQQQTVIVERPQNPSFGLRADDPLIQQTAITNNELNDIVVEEEKPKRKIVSRLILNLLLVASAYFGYQQFFNKVSVPQLVGKTQEQAIADLNKNELSGKVSEQVFNDITEAGTVLSATPKSGESVTKGTEVKLVVSKGPELATVPLVTGLNVADATSALTTARLKVGGTSQKYSATVVAGVVISTSPQGGEKLKLNSEVRLVVSLGPKPIQVTNVVGNSYSSALKKLKAAGFESIAQSRQYSKTVANGSVISMSPSAGTSGFADTEIKLVVSKGLPPVTVPSVTGVNMTTATNRLTKVGLKVSVKTVSCTGTRKGNVVTNQSASAGSQIATGSTVKITVAYICK